MRKLTLLIALLSLTAVSHAAVDIATLSAADQAKVAKFSTIAPTPRQLTWQQYELTAFFHFGINTFTGKEWGDGTEDPKLFNPDKLDCRQWIRAAKSAGVKLAILTAKHHDGFCLWPSKLTTHTVASSKWKNGRGDVCAEFVKACRAEKMKVGMYLSPWDRHEKTYGTEAYDDFFVGQINELFDAYGPIDEIWFDGACGEGPNGKKQEYNWARYYAAIRARNPNCVIAVSGPDVRWVGNESGLARESEWSVLPARAIDNNATKEGFENYHFEGTDVTKMAAQQEILKPVIIGDRKAPGALEAMLAADHWVWYPAECDVSIRPGWFYHSEQDGQVKSLDALLNIYFASVGRNAVLLLNIPPNKAGRVHENDVNRLKEFGATLAKTFSRNLAKPSREANVWTLARSPINVIMLQEDITKGQRVENFHVEALRPGSTTWETVATATTIGYKRLLRLPEPITATKLRLVIDATRAEPVIKNLGAFYLPTKASDTKVN